MHKIIVMNAKGGSGKTTIATNLASLYAINGYKTTLYDYDPQGSSSSWLKRRPDNSPHIYGIFAHQQPCASVTRSWQMRMPIDTQRVVVDTPAGVKAHEAVALFNSANTILVPVLSSVSDVEASARFIRELQKMVKANSVQARIIVVANRVSSRSPVMPMTDELFRSMGVPIVARLHDNINYLRCADSGLGMHDLPPQRAKTERRELTKIVAQIDDDFKPRAPTGVSDSTGKIRVLFPEARGNKRAYQGRP